MSRKTIMIIIIITLIGLCGLGAAAAAGGAGIYFSTRGSPTAVKALPSPKMIAPSLTPTDKITTSQADGMRLLYVPAGEFQMGSTEAQFQAAVTECVKEGGIQSDCQTNFDDEKPVHPVYLDAFRIDQTDVTNAMYARCVSAGACQAPSVTASSTRQGYYANSQYADYPVINVDWNQARGYCSWAGRSLPTEAQWEKAARGTDGRIYPWGNQPPGSSLLNFNDQDKGDTSQVDSYPAGASPYGALDMTGNVRNWVADWYGAVYPSQPPESNPTGPDSGTERVLRGGSWASWPVNSRSALRNHSDPSKGSGALSGFGFRCALSPLSATPRQPALRPTDQAAVIPTPQPDARPTPAVETTQTVTPSNFQVYFKNDCDKTAQFAIHYKNLDDDWVTDGWWELRPGEFAYVADTKNTIYYYYGEPEDGSDPWWGTDLNLTVNDSTKFYGFKENTIKNADWGEVVQSFICK